MNPNNINEIHTIIEVVDGKETGIMGIMTPIGMIQAAYSGKKPGVFEGMVEMAKVGVKQHRDNGENYGAVVVKFTGREVLQVF